MYSCILTTIFFVAVSADKKLRIFNLNAWAATFYDQGNSDPDFDVIEAKQEYVSYMSENYPNSLLLETIDLLPEETINAIINPAKAKKIRLEALCQHLNDENYDVVFLQEIWYEKDHEFLCQCTDHHYEASDFSKHCGKPENSAFLICDGLMTLVRRRAHDFDQLPGISLVNGDHESETILPLYNEYFLKRKALVHDAKINGIDVRLVNVQLASFFDDPEQQNRVLRRQQAELICEKLACKNGHYDLLILGMSMNDIPTENGVENEVYETFLHNCDLTDVFNPQQKKNVEYEKTYSNLRNSWRHNNPDLPMTLDYVMVKSYRANKKFCIKKAKVLDLTLRHPDTDQVLSISDHEPIEVEIEFDKEKKC